MLIIAHRGASAYAQENTLKAFDLAFKLGATWLETDVQRSKDGVLVLYHDYNLKNGKRIKDSTFDYLKKFNVPSLTELLQITHENFTLNLEIKNDDNIYPGIEKQILEKLKEAKNIRKEQILISSFSVKTLQKIRALDEQINIGVLTRNFEIKTPLSLKAKSVNISAKRVTKNIVDTCHKNGLKVLVYTVNNLKTYQEYQAWGVDGIFGDNPVLNSSHFFCVGGTK
ncbi:MAG: glycerophosphodiester phosphodiesterase [Elusimicrobiaceae bacterium]|nr:glycerophosphodiester phosphodiesterase [Elusimicrobiaceae bacterium]